jgi:hypothetical protein
MRTTPFVVTALTVFRDTVGPQAAALLLTPEVESETLGFLFKEDLLTPRSVARAEAELAAECGFRTFLV